MINFKFDILKALKEKGYTNPYFKKTHELSQSTIITLRKGSTNISVRTLNKICNLLNKTPNEIIEFVPDEKNKKVVDKA